MSRFNKRLISVSADFCFLTISLWMAFALRLESFTWLPDRHQVVAGGCTVLFTIYAFVRLGLYRAIIRYITERALLAVLSGVFISAVALIVTGYLLQAFIPRSVPVLYAGLSFLMVAGSRFLVRSLISRPVHRNRQAVVILGAGTKGVQLLAALRQGSDFCPVAFISTKAENHRSLIAGLPVYGLGHVESAIRQHGAGRVLLALEDSVSIDRNALISKLEPLSVAVQTVPSMSEVVSGKARIQDLRDLTLEDLLGRDPVRPDDAIVAESLEQKVVMVTGAGGSIGSELCRQIIRCRPRDLVIYDSSEFALYAIERELRTINDVESLAVNINALLGSVTNRKRCASTIRAFGVQTIYHAAAYKHVPVVEQNVIEGVQNNVFGTWHCAEAAIECGVERFVLISTDKAVRPTNVMGASKRLAELVLQALASRQKKTIFSMVRFGNVLGSSGSVVPLFREQIRNGGPVTVTHPDICRYFMTIPEASQLVLQAGGMGAGGEVFVLDMGDPVQIVDLARKMIHLMGLREKTGIGPGDDIEIVFTGLRPGEKLYEELLIGDDPKPTRHPRIMMARESMMSWESIKVLLDRLGIAIQQYDCRQVLRILVEDSITEFTPVSNLCDLVWCNSLDSSQPAVPVNDEEQKIRRLPL
ncbi:polysaccharide biosynthesis protein [Marinobacter bohaiensis]|uniref:polysaccharide biosynthesis protein n=1 Tax=Marinobacter bohaiensis TaxID=2201898 RepID=UPI000DACDCBA|nr:nucleoside-diphosphate sugar epimerase/dehydratase [Marinobacter bohaiensis]